MDADDAAGPTQLKQRLRHVVRSSRRRRSDEERAAAATALAGHLAALCETLDARTVSCYLSSPSEPGTGPFLAWAESHGVEVLLPVCRSDGLLDWTRGGDGIRMVRSVPEAVGAPLAVTAIRSADALFIPAAAVDRDGTRLGWGSAFFDKTLANVGKYPVVYAVIFDDELVEAVPREAHDRAVAGVVTPGGVVALGDGRARVPGPRRHPEP